MHCLDGHGVQGQCASAAASSSCTVCLALRKLSAINFCTDPLLEGSNDWVIHLSKIFFLDVLSTLLGEFAARLC